jgi:hypothetical protein
MFPVRQRGRYIIRDGITIFFNAVSELISVGVYASTKETTDTFETEIEEDGEVITKQIFGSGKPENTVGAIDQVVGGMWVI